MSETFFLITDFYQYNKQYNKSINWLGLNGAFEIKTHKSKSLMPCAQDSALDWIIFTCLLWCAVSFLNQKKKPEITKFPDVTDHKLNRQNNHIHSKV